jgi:hypothetical protein
MPNERLEIIEELLHGGKDDGGANGLADLRMWACARRPPEKSPGA